jgi:high-affinity iron transporter
VVGLVVGIFVGYMLYRLVDSLLLCVKWCGMADAKKRGGSSTRLQVFLVVSTCLLYLVAAGLLSRAVWAFEAQRWSTAIGADAADIGDGPGSYDIDNSVWHVNVSGASTLPGDLS